jgi:hypothetical protein
VIHRAERVDIHHAEEPTEKSTEDQNIKLPESLKAWLTQNATAVSQATGDARFGASSLGRKAVEFYKMFFDAGLAEKAERYFPALRAWLDQMP